MNHSLSYFFFSGDKNLIKQAKNKNENKNKSNSKSNSNSNSMSNSRLQDSHIGRIFPLICPLAIGANEANDTNVFAGRVFFILIRNIELHGGASEKERNL